VETTGLNRATSNVLQVAIVLFVNGRPNGKRVWWIDPEVRIPKNATKVNRIRDEDVRGKGNFTAHATDISRILAKYPLVGHNLSFDYCMLRAECTRAGVAFNADPLFCTMKNLWRFDAIHSEAQNQKYRYQRNARSAWRKLGDLANDLGVIPAGDLHDAFVDAMLAGQCFVFIARNEIQQYRDRVSAAAKEVERTQRLLSDLISG
jgi:DNA polymerase III epsilon subunit-like protein